MVKHTQTIRRQQPTNCLSVFDHFVNLALKGLKKNENNMKLLDHIGLLRLKQWPCEVLIFDQKAN